jgi:hypothetical protein
VPSSDPGTQRVLNLIVDHVRQTAQREDPTFAQSMWTALGESQPDAYLFGYIVGLGGTAMTGLPQTQDQSDFIGDYIDALCRPSTLSSCDYVEKKARSEKRCVVGFVDGNETAKALLSGRLTSDKFARHLRGRRNARAAWLLRP